MTEISMHLSVVIPIGNFSSNFENIQNIVKESDNSRTEFVFILDTNESLAFQKLNELCAEYLKKNYMILISDARDPGSSRNLGIAACSGEWIIFCDCDDFPYLENVLKSISLTNKNSQVLIGSFEIENVGLIESKASNCKLVTNKEWKTIASNPGMWRWIFRRTLLSTVRFPKLSMGEDQFFLIQILSLEPEIELTNEVFYKYRFGTINSLTKSKDNLKDLVSVLKLELAIKKFPKEYEAAKNLLVLKQIITLFRRGKFFQKLQALNFCLQFLYSTSIPDYKACLDFIVFLIRNK